MNSMPYTELYHKIQVWVGLIGVALLIGGFLTYVVIQLWDGYRRDQRRKKRDEEWKRNQKR